MRRLSFSSTGRITLLPSFYVAALLLNVLMLTIEGWHVPTVRSSSLLTNKIRSHGSIFPFCSTSSTSPVCCRPPRPTLTRLHANFPEDEQEEEEWPGSLRRSGQEGGNGGGGGEGPNGPRGQDVQPDVVMVDMTEVSGGMGREGYERAANRKKDFGQGRDCRDGRPHLTPWPLPLLSLRPSLPPSLPPSVPPSLPPSFLLGRRAPPSDGESFVQCE